MQDLIANDYNIYLFEMKKLLSKLVVLLLVLQLITSTPLLSYDPKTGASANSQQVKHSTQYKWFYKRTLSGGGAGYSYESVSFVLDAANNQKVVKLASTQELKLKALSDDFTCAVLLEASTPKKVNVYKFDAADNPTSLEDLFAKTIVDDTNADSANTTYYQVADSCTAIRVGDSIRHFDVSADPKFKSDTIPTAGDAWVKPVASSNFNFVAGDAGLYAYATGAYTKIASITETFHANKKVWSSSSAILVFSWKDGSTAGTKDYKLNVFAITTGTPTTYTQVTKIEGISKTKEPTVVFSETFKTIIVYGQLANSTQFATGIVVDYTAKTKVDLTIPDWAKATKSVFDVSDKYVYIRNIVDKTGVTPAVKEQGAYFIAGGQLQTYLEPKALVSAETTNWVSSMVYTSQGQFLLLRQHKDPTSDVITIEVQADPNQIFKWDKKNKVPTTSVTGADTEYRQSTNRPRWYLKSKKSATAFIYQTITLNTAQQTKSVSVELDDKHILKALSNNYRCSVFHDTTSGDGVLKVYQFDDSSATAALKSTLSASLHTGVNLAAAATTYQISDDCSSLRIAGKLFNWVTSAYVAVDILTDITTWTNAVFSEDFKVAATDNAIYTYKVKSGSQAKDSYQLLSNQTLYTSKKFWNQDNNMIIYTWKFASTIYDYKVIFYVKENNVWNKISEFAGTSKTQEPKLLISPKLSKVILVAMPNTGSIPTYTAKFIDYGKKVVRDISLPTAITSAACELALSDQFLVGMTLKATPVKLLTYVSMGSTLIQISNENFNLPVFSLATEALSRPLVIPMTDGDTNKLVIAYQYGGSESLFIRLLRSISKSIGQIINPNQVSPNQLEFTYSSTLFRQSQPQLGKWVYTTDSGATLNYIEYDPSKPDKKKTLKKQSLTANNAISAISSSLDCAVTFIDTSELNVFPIKSSAATPTIDNGINIFSTVTAAGQDATQIKTAYDSGKISVGNGCWAVRVDNLIYVKGADPSTTFTKNVAAGGLTTPVYDSTLNFAYAGGKLYKYGTTYEEIATGITGLKTTIKLYANADKSKVCIFTYEAGTGSTYDAVMKMYSQPASGTTWTAITIPAEASTFSTVSGAPTFLFSPTFETFGYTYTQASQAGGNKPFVGLAKLSGTTLTAYETPTDMQQDGTTVNLMLFENYIFFMKKKPSVSASEIFYKIDKTNTKLIEVGKRSFPVAQFDLIKNVKLTQQSSQLVAFHEIQISGSKVRVIKRVIGSADAQRQIKGIQTREAGLMIKDGKFILCSTGCALCTNPSTCLKCLDGFGLDTTNNICSRCSLACKDCSSPSVCTTCMDGFFKSGNVCNRCNQNCQTCQTSSSFDKCLSCKVGFYLTTSLPTAGPCSPCIDNCVSCSSSTDCNACKRGYVYDSVSSSCVKCIAGCTNCKPNEIHKCNSCGDGFFAVQNGATITSCSRCSVNCKSCTSTSCSQCRPGFRLVNNACIPQCRLPCKDCSTSDPTKCTSCIGGYNLNGDSCTPDLSCNAGKTCTGCVIGYSLVLGECKQCNGGANCRTCDPTNVEQCATCNRGFYLTSTGVCRACSIDIFGCESCDNQATCSRCRPGFVLEGSGLSRCVKCDSSCATCFQSPKNCETCAEGFTQKGWKCANKNNVKLNLELDGNFADFTTANFTTIQQSIAELVNKDRSQITVEELRSGSIIIVSTIDTDNNLQQNQMVAALQSSLANGLTIGGFTVKSSSVTAVTAGTVDPNIFITQDEATKYRNIAIIVGVVIPVSLIIIFIVIIILMKKGVICASGALKVQDGSSMQIMNRQKESELGTMRVK